MQSLYRILEPRQVGNTKFRQSTQIMFLYQMMMIIMMIFGKHQNRTISLITQQQRVDLSFRSVVPINLRFSLVDRKSKMIMFKRWQRITEYATFWKKRPFCNQILIRLHKLYIQPLSSSVAKFCWKQMQPTCFFCKMQTQRMSIWLVLFKHDPFLTYNTLHSWKWFLCCF